MSNSNRWLSLWAALSAACGSSSSSQLPSTPSTVVASPTPSPLAATPTPSPTSALPTSCRTLPPAVGTAQGCRQETSDFLKAVTDAVSTAQNSAAVDPDTRENYALLQGGVIQSPNAYLKVIIDALDRQGLCAVYDGEELDVRNSNGYNELFDVITSSGGSWVKYMSTCSPATPVPSIAPPPVRDAECKLAPSRDSYCDRPSSVYAGDVAAALDDLIAQERLLATPLIFDFSQRSPGQDTGWKVSNIALYFSEVARRLRVKGYCSDREGDDELLIKRGTNRFSEHWDLLQAGDFSLRLLAVTCRDAAF